MSYTGEKPVSRNQRLLDSFVAYCRKNPDLRFWQALLNWSKVGFILVADYDENPWARTAWNPDTIRDTYEWEGRNDDLSDDPSLLINIFKD